MEIHMRIKIWSLNVIVSLPAWPLFLSEIRVCSATVCPSSSYTDPSRPLDAGSCLPVYQSCVVSPATWADMMKRQLMITVIYTENSDHFKMFSLRFVVMVMKKLVLMLTVILITWSSFSVWDFNLQTFTFISEFSSSSCCTLGIFFFKLHKA